MKFAKVVFWIAGIWGVLIITPMFFLRSALEHQAPATILTHPEFYYGFAAAVLMWQVSFFILASDPARYRGLMIPPAFAKLGYAIIIVLLYGQGEPVSNQLLFAAVDAILALLFIIAFFRTKSSVLHHRMHLE